MESSIYYVVLHEGKWNIRFEEKHYGPYITRKTAIRKAIDSAHADGNNGQDAQVLVQDADNSFRTEWTYGSDPYPVEE
jgi:hypothetical protein